MKSQPAALLSGCGAAYYLRKYKNDTILSIKRCWETLKSFLKFIFGCYAEIFFLKGYEKGILLCCCTLINPSILLAGLISLIPLYFFARLIRFGTNYIIPPFYVYNSLLVGFSIGFLFKITPLSLLLIFISGILTFLVTTLIDHILQIRLKLPILSVPFVIVSSIVYLYANAYSNILVRSDLNHFKGGIDIGLPFWIGGFFKSLGAIFFSPYVLTGAVIALLILLSSRILFLLSVAGYYAGTIALATLQGSTQLAFADVTGFNFALTAMAIGGIFFTPSARNYVLALMAVLISTIFCAIASFLLAQSGLSLLPLPFNVVTLFFIYFASKGYIQPASIIRDTPEESLACDIALSQRYNSHYRALTLPFAGRWTVWQEFDGEWTHRDMMRYAYDFILTDETGRSFSGMGRSLHDYYAYMKPVLSPVKGRVVKVVSSLPDNEVGQVDRERNWGNLVIIQAESGFFVEISHLSGGSIMVREGDQVERGSKIGNVGNSGYSPEPHIHIQVQATAEIGAYTLPFNFVDYLSGRKFHSFGLPARDEKVEAIYREKGIENKMKFSPGSESRYDIIIDNKKVNELALTTIISPDGTTCLESDKGRLYFGVYSNTFYFHRVEGNDRALSLIFMSMPRLPLAYREGMEWEDQIPASIVTKGFTRWVAQVCSSFCRKIANVRCEYRFTGRNKIAGLVRGTFSKGTANTYVELDEPAGFGMIRVDNITIIRK